ncbi:hypothetical protein AABB24_030831, partial [Solanum stoloniferum]
NGFTKSLIFRLPLPRNPAKFRQPKTPFPLSDETQLISPLFSIVTGQTPSHTPPARNKPKNPQSPVSFSGRNATLQTTSIHHFLRPQQPATKQTFNHLKTTRPTTKRHHPSTQKTTSNRPKSHPKTAQTQPKSRPKPT